jgi:hypothetical protein
LCPVKDLRLGMAFASLSRLVGLYTGRIHKT